MESLKKRGPDWIALGLALAADGVQLVMTPSIVLGGLVLQDAVDVLACFVLSLLLGWNWAFLPTFIAELVPGLNLFPTWTAAVLFVTLRKRRSAEGTP